MNQPSQELPVFGNNLKLRHCLYGWMLFDGPYIGKCFELYGEYSESEVTVFRKYLREGYFAIDIGANIGDLTLPLSKIVGNEGRIVAVESHPETFNVLCTNLALNGITNVKPINAFIADSREIDTGSDVWGPHAYTGTVWEPSIVSLDDFSLSKCDFIKIDVDGKELEILRSGKQTIDKHRPILYFENDVKAKSKELLEYVLGLDYRLFAHWAPIFRPDNFLGNPINNWDRNICSLMILGIPSGNNDRPTEYPFELQEITDSDFWWQ